jgi:Hypoxanthine-guanine phosphoribosyltransferase
MKELTGNLKRLFSPQEIKDRVENMGEKISNQYSNSNPIFIGVLNGSFIFMADLLRTVSVDCEVDFIKVRSYSGKKSSGTIKLLKDISCDIKDQGM